MCELCLLCIQYYYAHIKVLKILMNDVAVYLKYDSTQNSIHKIVRNPEHTCNFPNMDL